MSKMPAKKKSCFQITSVTPAQVAASALADDTESLEDPDESRAEEVVPRGDVVVGVAGGSSPLEEVSGIHGELLLGPANGGVSFRIVAPAAVGPQVGGAAPTGGSSQTLPTTTLPTSSCTSRFRVIKLDHGTGEPFRRGRWTCVEFYEKDPDSSGGSRAAESLRHASHLEHSLDRDSGLGTTVNSAAVSSMLSGQGPDAGLDGSFSSAPQVLQTEPPPQQSNGAVLPGAFQPAGHTPIPAQPAAVPQNLLPAGHDSAPQNVPPQQVQQSPGPPGYVYPGQLPPGHLISGQQTSPTDYRQPHLTVPQPQSTGGPLPAQGPLPTFIPAASGALPLGIPGQTVDLATLGQPPPAQGHLLQLKPISQYQPSGGSPVGVGLQGVPAATSIAANQTLTSVEQPHVGRGLGVQAPFFGSSMEDSRKQPDALPQGPMSSLMDPSKLSVTENLQLPAPPVNNLFGIAISKDEDDDGNPSTVFYKAFRSSRLQESKGLRNSLSGASVVAIDNKIEQAMDLVKSHLMYAVREEVEVLKEQIKELNERNSVLERENALLKSLANSEQLSQLTQVTVTASPSQDSSHTVSPSLPPQPNVSSA